MLTRVTINITAHAQLNKTKIYVQHHRLIYCLIGTFFLLSVYHTKSCTVLSRLFTAV